MICGVPVDGEGTVPDGDAVDPVEPVLDPVESVSPFDPVVSAPERLLLG